MGIEIKINIDLTPRQKRIMRGAVVCSVVVGALGLGVAFATVPNTFNTGDPLSSQKMNQNFTSLDTRITTLEVAYAKQSLDGGYATAASYCGVTVSSTLGDLSGITGGTSSYAKTKSACVAQCASSGAHMCTPDEVLRSVVAGESVPSGWFSSGIAANVPQNGGPAVNYDDCAQWTSAASTDLGQLWSDAGPSSDSCNDAHTILCCD